MKVLVDTSVWSLALRRTQTGSFDTCQELRNLIVDHRAEIIGPIRQELLSGIRDAGLFERLKKYLAAFPDIALRSDDFVSAAKLFNICRSKGVQGSNTDYLMCAVAIRMGLAIFTSDKDFSRFKKHIPIVFHSF